MAVKQTLYIRFHLFSSADNRRHPAWEGIKHANISTVSPAILASAVRYAPWRHFFLVSELASINTDKSDIQRVTDRTCRATANPQQ